MAEEFQWLDENPDDKPDDIFNKFDEGEESKNDDPPGKEDDNPDPPEEVTTSPFISDLMQKGFFTEEPKTAEDFALLTLNVAKEQVSEIIKSFNGEWKTAFKAAANGMSFSDYASTLAANAPVDLTSAESQEKYVRSKLSQNGLDEIAINAAIASYKEANTLAGIAKGYSDRDDAARQSMAKNVEDKFANSRESQQREIISNINSFKESAKAVKNINGVEVSNENIEKLSKFIFFPSIKEKQGFATPFDKAIDDIVGSNDKSKLIALAMFLESGCNPSVFSTKQTKTDDKVIKKDDKQIKASSGKNNFVPLSEFMQDIK